jgi:hypothetical protein
MTGDDIYITKQGKKQLSFSFNPIANLISSAEELINLSEAIV